MEWPAVVFGWPGPILAILCLLVAAGTRHAGFLIASAVLVLPFSLYLAASPRFQFWGLLLAALPLVAFLAVRRRAWWGAAASLAMFVGWIGWIAVQV
jgi:hypothetical protein